MWLRVPKGTDIRDPKAVAGADTVECPQHTRRFYTVQWVDDIGLGFTNEHRFAVIQALGTWPTPFWSTGAPLPPPLPFPPTVLANFSSGGVAANSVVFPVNPSSAGNLTVVIEYGGPAGPAVTCNGNAPLTGSTQNINAGTQVINVAVFFFAVVAGAQNVTVQMPVGTNRQIAGYAMWENYLTVPPQASNVATGLTPQPSVTAATNPFGASLKLMLGTFGMINPPAGFAVASPWIPVAQASEVITTNTLVVQTSCIVSPTGGLPNLTENPAGGPWVAWVGQIDMGS
jgi:hypothetical protein